METYHDPATTPRRVLLVEDDDAHAQLITLGFQGEGQQRADAPPPAWVERVASGEAALETLGLAAGPAGAAPGDALLRDTADLADPAGPPADSGDGQSPRLLPDLVLLDLKLPGVNGLEVLEAVKADPRTAHVPVVMLSTSNARQDRLRAAELGANAYVVKPLEFVQLERAMYAVRVFWCGAHEPMGGPDDRGLA